MESCVMKPEIKKKPKPPKPPPKPAQVKQNYPEQLQKPTPVIPPRPTNTELNQTQYRMKRLADKQINGTMIQGERKERQPRTPVVPPRPTDEEMKNTTRHSHRRRVQADDNTQVHTDQQRPRSDRLPPPRRRSRETDQSEATSDEVDFRQANQPVVTGKVWRNQKEQTFTSYLPGDHKEEEKRADLPSKQTPASKSAGLKGVMKGLQLKSAPKASSREPSPDPSKDEKESLREKKNPESRQDIGGLFAGMFRKTPKDRSTSAVNKADSDSDPTEDEEEDDDEEKTSEQTRDKGGFFSGVLKKNNKPAEESPAQETLSVPTQLSASSDSLTENKEKVNIFSAMFKRKPAEAAQTDEDQTCLHGDLSDSNDHLLDPSEDKGGFFSGILRKSPRLPPEAPAGPGAELSQSDSSASADSVSDNKEKAGVFSGLLKKTPKPPKEENLFAQKEVSVSADSLSDTAKTKERGGAFAGMFKKASRPADGPNTEDEKQDDEPSTGSEGSSEDSTKDKGGIFSGIFKKAPKTTEASQPEEDGSPDNELSASNENLSESKPEKGRLFSGLRKKTPRASAEWTASQDREAPKELSASNDSLSDAAKDRNIFSNIFKKPQKPAEGAAADNVEPELSREVSGSCENLCDTTQKEKKGGLAGLFKRSVSIENIFDEEKGGLFSGRLKKPPKATGDEEAAEDKDAWKELSASNDSLFENSKERSIFSGIFKKTPKAAEEPAAEEDSTGGEDVKFSASCENLTEESTLKEKTGGLAGMFKKSPRPALRSVASKDPLTDAKEKSISCDSLTGISNDNFSGGELSASTDNLCDAASGSKEKKTGFAGIFKRTPKTVEQQESVDMEPSEGGGLRRRRTIKKKRRVVSFRVKTTLPRMPKLTLSQTADKMPVIEESLELQEMTPAQESTVEVQPVEMAAYPTEGNLLESDEESDGLMEWWNSVEGWAEWNETSNFQEEDEEMAIEEAADRVYMAARLFVRLFNQRGATLQQHILELLALADAADQFHKKTVSAAIGGGVASVAGSVATITGLILAPFTFGASIIVTAVGISVATAGSITSATANITDTVHSNMDRKKVERMILNYQEEIKDIRECLEFVQEGMDTLQEWDFEKFSESAGKKALNHNIKHVMKEGGRAGKALMINTDKLISTVQVLGAAGGVVKAAQAITVTTGVMSALFLALDVFFLAKDSHELRKGAKTKFATKIREVCKDLQDGLLELNRVKTQLQKTMDGIEVEEYEEIEEVEVEVDDDLESDPKKLAELEQELDLLEEKLDKKVEEEQRGKETDGKSTRDKVAEKSMKELEEEEEEEEEKEGKKERGDGMVKGKKTEVETGGEDPAKDEALKERQKGSKREKETENRRTAGRERQTEEKEKDDGGREADGPTKTCSERGSQSSLGKERETEGEETRRHSSSRSHRGSSHRKSEEERGVNDRRAEMKTESKRREREDHVWRVRREEKRGSRVEEHGQSRRRGSDREKERSRRGDRHRSSVLREDGLYI